MKRITKGDHVRYTPNKKDWGLFVTGSLHAIDEGYRAYIFSDTDIKDTGIKKNDIVKVLLSQGTIEKLSDRKCSNCGRFIPEGKGWINSSGETFCDIYCFNGDLDDY